MKYATVVLMLFFGIAGATASDRNVLVEAFTNAHCPLCPPADAALEAYNSTSMHADRIRYIYYHMTFPYPDDPISQANTQDPADRDTYYGTFSSTPTTFFDGMNEGTSYNSWAGALDARVAVPAPLTIGLSGTVGAAGFNVDASITATAAVPDTDLRLHFVLVETVEYQGRNGVHPQYFAMRKMIGGAAGDPFSITSGETKTVTKQSPLTNVEEPLSSGVVVFVQSAGSKEVLQSEYIGYGMLTAVADPARQPIPGAFTLSQNYPNPFNPSTLIAFSVKDAGPATLTVFNLLGEKVATLFNGQAVPGEIYREKFNAASLPSGFYFYRLQSGREVAVKRMMLLK